MSLQKRQNAAGLLGQTDSLKLDNGYAWSLSSAFYTAGA